MNLYTHTCRRFLIFDRQKACLRYTFSHSQAVSEEISSSLVHLCSTFSNHYKKIQSLVKKQNKIQFTHVFIRRYEAKT